MSDHYGSVPRDLPGQIGKPAPTWRDQLNALHRALIAAKQANDDDHVSNLEHRIQHMEHAAKWRGRQIREAQAGVIDEDRPTRSEWIFS
jgi:hypothetical protein